MKIAPDLNEEELVDIAEAAELSGVDGIIVSNTTVQRPTSLQSRASLPLLPAILLLTLDVLLDAEHAGETGGLSGPPLLPYALRTIRTLRTLLPPSIPLIGCGGISSGSDALAFAQAGASTVQLYTAMSVEGAGAPRRIKDELSRALGEGGKTWKEVSKGAVEELAGTHPRRYAARQAKAREESTLVAESEELKREAEALKSLLAGAGVQDSDALREALSDTQLDDALTSLGLEMPTDESVGLGLGVEQVEEVKAVVTMAAMVDAVAGAPTSGMEAPDEEKPSETPVVNSEEAAPVVTLSPKTVTRLV